MRTAIPTLDDYRRQEVDADSVKAEKILVEGRMIQAECGDPLHARGGDTVGR